MPIEGILLPAPEVLDGCEPPDLSVENETLVLCKSS